MPPPNKELTGGVGPPFTEVSWEGTVFQTAREWEGKNTTLDGFGR